MLSAVICYYNLNMLPYAVRYMANSFYIYIAPNRRVSKINSNALFNLLKSCLYTT